MGLLDGVLGDALGGMTGGNAGANNLQGMLGGLLGQLGGTPGGNSNAMLTTVMSLVQQHGGVEGLIAKFQAGGLSQVLGDSTINTVASSMGVDPSHASSSIASMLPELINQLTPHGVVDAGSSDVLAKGLSMLKGLSGQ
jgi:uncharacterized protein YidB (DUF937 family)